MFISLFDLAIVRRLLVSKVILPPKGPILVPGRFGEGTPGPRYFDFSDAPAVPDFDPTASCQAEYTIRGKQAYRANIRTGGSLPTVCLNPLQNAETPQGASINPP